MSSSPALPLSRDGALVQRLRCALGAVAVPSAATLVHTSTGETVLPNSSLTSGSSARVGYALSRRTRDRTTVVKPVAKLGSRTGKRNTPSGSHGDFGHRYDPGHTYHPSAWTEHPRATHLAVGRAFPRHPSSSPESDRGDSRPRCSTLAALRRWRGDGPADHHRETTGNPMELRGAPGRTRTCDPLLRRSPGR